MTGGTYPKSEPLRTKPRPLSGAGIAEIVVLIATVAAGVGIGIALNSLVLGFAVLLALAVIARVMFAVLGDGPPRRSHPHRHEQARP